MIVDATWKMRPVDRIESDDVTWQSPVGSAESKRNQQGGDLEIKRAVLLALLAISLPVSGAAQPPPTSEEINKANHPLTPQITINLQHQYVGSFFGLDDRDSNEALLRGVLPHKLFGWPQLLGVSVPIVTSPDLFTGSVTGLGDIEVFDVFLLKAGVMDLGFGPLFTIDSATDDRLGTGKWQAGAAGAAIAPQSWGLIGGIVKYQHSFAAGGDRPTQNNFEAQPFVTFNLPQGFYLRSTAIWDFDLERGHYVIPLGFGVGKVWRVEGGTTLNLFVEPQWTVAYDGIAPQFQLLFGLFLQLPLRRAEAR